MYSVKELMGKKIKLTREYSPTRKGDVFTVIGRFKDNSAITVYKEEMRGHTGCGYDIEFINGFKTEEERGEHCWNVNPKDIEIVSSYKYFFNKLAKGDKNG